MNNYHTAVHSSTTQIDMKYELYRDMAIALGV